MQTKKTGGSSRARVKWNYLKLLALQSFLDRRAVEFIRFPWVCPHGAIGHRMDAGPNFVRGE
jgi:hypothetical protein